MRKVFQRLKLVAAPLFAGHKLLLEELRKYVKGNSLKATGVIDKLKENSKDKHQAAYFAKDYIPELAYYWYLGGKKLNPTLKEINEFINKYWKGEYKSFQELPNFESYWFK